MPVMDEFKEERAALKDASLLQKIIYFWDYYKWHTIALIAGAIVIYSLVHNILTQKESVFYGAFINAVELGGHSAEYSARFGELLGIDLNEYEVSFDNSMFIDINVLDQSTTAAMQRIMVYMGAGDIDIAVTDDEVFNHYAYLDSFLDIRTLLTPAQQAKYEPYYYYVDKKIVREQARAAENFDTSYVKTYPDDPFDPSSMAEPVPVGIRMNSCQTLMDTYHFKDGKDILFGVFVTSKRPDIAIQYLDFAFADTAQPKSITPQE